MVKYTMKESVKMSKKLKILIAQKIRKKKSTGFKVLMGSLLVLLAILIIGGGL